MAKEFMPLFFEHMHEAAVVCEMVQDAEGRVTDWMIRDANAAARQVIGRKREELVDQAASRLFHPSAVTWLTREQERLLNTEGPSQSEVQFQHRHYLISTFAIDERTIACIGMDITGRKQAEELLRQSHDQAAWLARLPDENPNPVLRVALDGAVLYRNSTAGRLSGWIGPAGDRVSEPLLALLQAALARGEKTEEDLTLDGHDYSITLMPFPAEGYINVYGADITDSKRAEEALRKSEEKFAMVFRSSPIALAIIRASDYRFMDANPGHFLLSGYTREEVIGRTSAELRLFVDPAQREELIRLLKEQGSVRDYEMEIRNKAGEVSIGLFSFERIELDGEPCVLISTIDITDRKRSEEALRESRERERARAKELETLMDAVPAMIWISRDPQCRSMIGNHLGHEFLRLGPDANVSVTAPEAERVTQPYRNLKDGREIPPTEMPMQVAAATGKPARDFTFDLVFDDGRVCHLIGNVNPLFDERSRPYGAVGAFMDITPIRRMEAREVEAKAQIEVQTRLMEYREQERLGIARDLHDGPIQTLASTAFNIQFIKETSHDPMIQIELQGIALSVKNAVRELRDIVNDLRPPSLIRFGLIRAIRMHAEDMQERYPETEIALDLTEEPDHLSEYACLTLFRILQEGLNNALRHSGAGKITIRYAIDQDSFLLELRDNGKGFVVHQELGEIAGEGHFGLVGMRERALTVGAEFSLNSAPGRGTTLQVHGPLLGKNLKD